MRAAGGLRNVHPLPQGSVALTRGLNGKDECRGFWGGGASLSGFTAIPFPSQ